MAKQIGFWGVLTTLAVFAAQSAGFAATTSFVAINGDSDVSVSTGNQGTFTSLLDFGNGGTATINGVAFTQVDAGTAVGNSTNTFATTHNGNTDFPIASGGVVNLLRDMVFGNGGAAGKVTLTGLTVGQNYETRVYVRGWITGDATRAADLYFYVDNNTTPNNIRYVNESNASEINPAWTPNQPFALVYTYTATRSQMTVAFNTTAQNWHLYGMTNQQVNQGPPILPGTAQTTWGNWTVNTTNDLILNRAPSAAAPAGGWAQAGSYGGNLSALTNGTGSGRASAGHTEWVQYSLGTNPLGYDITSISTYGGWGDTGRASQVYDVYYSTVADPNTWIQIGNVVSFTSGGTASEVTISSLDLAPLATGAGAVEFVFSDGPNGYQGYDQLVVTGVATIPEPAAFALLALGALVCLRRRT